MSALIPFPRTGKRAALIAYPRTGKRASLLPFPRSGKRALNYEFSLPIRLNHYSFDPRMAKNRNRIGKKEFPTHSQIPHDHEIPSPMNDYNESNQQHIVHEALSQDTENGVNSEQGIADLRDNLGLFDLDPEEIGMPAYACNCHLY